MRATESPAFQETAESRGALMDELILSRVSSVLDRSFGSGIATLGGVNATVSAGKVILSGAATSEERLIVEAVRLVRDAPELALKVSAVLKKPIRTEALIKALRGIAAAT